MTKVIRKAGKLKTWLKSIVPKLSGLAILALTGIEHKGKLPQTKEEWILILIGLGITFASNSQPKTKEVPHE
jgi:hypothetical protein